MPLFSQRSKSVLNGCAVGLQVLFNRVIQKRDCTVLPDGGKRTPERQKELMGADKSKVSDPLDSAHVPKNAQGEYDPSMLSNAADVLLYQADKPEYGGLDWRTDKALFEALADYIAAQCGADPRGVDGDIQRMTNNEHFAPVLEILENIKRHHNFTGYVMGVADTMAIPVRNGQDWDKDGKFDDQKFNDTPHWELISRRG